MHDDVIQEDFVLNEAEIETLRRAAVARNLNFDPKKTTLSKLELQKYGLVREAYTPDELRAAGFGPSPVTSFDHAAEVARDVLRVDAPFGSGILKWQLPVNMMELRVFQTVFQPDTVVAPHIHPVNTEEDPGGSLRIVVKGSIEYEGRSFEPGDWFFVPNGAPYTFRSAPNQETTVMYLYRFFAATEGNRFSHPHAA